MAIENDNTVSILVRKMPPELKQDFKALCAKEGTSMQDKIKEWIEEAVKK